MTDGVVYRYRFINGEWVRSWFGVRVEVVNPSEWLCYATVKGRQFHATEPETAIKYALDWLRTKSL